MHIAENKIRAWLYFFFEAERKGKEKPTMDAIVKIEIDKRITNFKKGY